MKRAQPAAVRSLARLARPLLGATSGAADARERRSVALGTAGTAALNVATMVLNFAIALVLARTLGTAGFGAYAFAFAWATFLSVPASLGLTPLVVRHVATYAAHERWGHVRGIIRRANQAVAASATVLVVAAGAIGLLVFDRDQELLGPFMVGLLLVPLMSLTSLRQAAMQGLNRVLLGRLPDTIVLPGTFLLLVVVAAVFLGERFDAESAIALNVGAVGIAFVVGIVLLRMVLPQAAHDAAPEYEGRAWVRAGIPLLGIAVLFVINGQVGTILVGALGGAAEAGTFNVAFRVATFTSFFFLAATYPLYPSVARLWAVGDREAIQRLLTRAGRVVLALSCVIGAVVILAARPLLEVFGPEFAEGTTALRILVLGELLKVAAGFGGLALVMTPHETAMAQGTAVGVALNLGLLAVLVPIWGVTGAAVALSASSLAAGAAVAWLAWRRLGVYAPAVGPLRLRGSASS